MMTDDESVNQSLSKMTLDDSDAQKIIDLMELDEDSQFKQILKEYKEAANMRRESPLFQDEFNAIWEKLRRFLRKNPQFRSNIPPTVTYFVETDVEMQDRKDAMMREEESALVKRLSREEDLKPKLEWHRCSRSYITTGGFWQCSNMASKPGDMRCDEHKFEKEFLREMSVKQSSVHGLSIVIH